ncbi:MAG TPA: peptidylprolyl isomerase [Polyangiales bacterium]|nr:peptidylprolyl isomerase [Polyangiales bacterium]
MTAESSRATWLLWLGLAGGLAVAIGSSSAPAVRGRPAAIPDGAVAVVNGTLVLRADYDAELARLVASERRRATERDKRAVVQRLIEEQLMLERGIELGMVHADGPTRRALLSAVVAAERGSADLAPTPEALESLYREAAGQLEQPGELRLRQLTFRVLNQETTDATRARAQDAVRRLRAGESFEQVRGATAADTEPDPLPDRPLTSEELRERIGPIALAAARALQPGGVSDVLGTGSLLRVLQLVERGEPELPPLQQIRAQVQRLYQQRAAERALAARIAALREHAEIRVAETLP